MSKEPSTQNLVLKEIASIFRKYYGYDYDKMLEILAMLRNTIRIFKNYEERHKNDGEKNKN